MLLESHLYVATVANVCARCRGPEDRHPKPQLPAETVSKTVEPMTGGDCSIDHDSLLARLLIGSDGLEWARCPFCNTMAEKRFERIGAQGNPYDPGRGALTDRMKKWLRGWKGWVDFNDRGS